ncbi:MAG: hypothetical protein LBO69_06925 [Ignavibacteria bacterium]|nr:hypothetical protein [Ignavibacteria bacterium]
MQLDNNYSVSDSSDRDNYEILIKQKGEDEFQSYCPQLNMLVKGHSFNEVYEKVDAMIMEHIVGMMTSDDNDSNID